MSTSFGFKQKDLAPMKSPRAYFGCLYFQQKAQQNKIIVAGGMHNGFMESTCEIYDVADNEWTDLP